MFYYVLQIPAAIKEFYEQPPNLLPPPTLESGISSGEDNSQSTSSETSLEDQEHVRLGLWFYDKSGYGLTLHVFKLS